MSFCGYLRVYQQYRGPMEIKDRPPYTPLQERISFHIQLLTSFLSLTNNHGTKIICFISSTSYATAPWHLRFLASHLLPKNQKSPQLLGSQDQVFLTLLRITIFPHYERFYMLFQFTPNAEKRAVGGSDTQDDQTCQGRRCCANLAACQEGLNNIMYSSSHCMHIPQSSVLGRLNYGVEELPLLFQDWNHYNCLSCSFLHRILL